MSEQTRVSHPAVEELEKAERENRKGEPGGFQK
jgi:hypothetical protein